ncbi:hypothetical protein LSH36_155g06030 [Paralvinella palmiformis]|uniref:Uncharacterized protein n=1 Tax=Paralvinella palmiformis TaxID=53620 RepID=A0AAD9N8G6_9ANNE|nr:hypothetical protein LSH36_155g06030 [Paralvinella palmiformis]
MKTVSLLLLVVIAVAWIPSPSLSKVRTKRSAFDEMEILFSKMPEERREEYSQLKTLEKFAYRAVMLDMFYRGKGIVGDIRNGEQYNEHLILRHMTPEEKHKYESLSPRNKLKFRKEFKHLIDPDVGKIKQNEKYLDNQAILARIPHKEREIYEDMKPMDKFLFRTALRQRIRVQHGTLRNAEHLNEHEFIRKQSNFRYLNQGELSSEEKELFLQEVKDVLMADRFVQMFAHMKGTQGGERNRERVMLKHMTPDEIGAYESMEPMDKFMFRASIRQRLYPGHGIISYARKGRLIPEKAVLFHMTPSEKEVYLLLSVRERRQFRKSLQDILMADTIRRTKHIKKANEDEARFEKHFRSTLTPDEREDYGGKAHIHSVWGSK